ncbi:MAG: hypothetical protein LBP53_01355 [Candidatus Peribacteria bacterium]|jgi:hypothetical protein|nr:hypothetical protein [Candidatus Peribacteria bacterium]
MRQPIDNVVIFAENSLKLIPNLTTLGLNQTGILQIFDANFTEQTVFLSDNVRGTFVPNSVELTSTNGYVAEVEYRPAGLGEVTITASSISTVNTILTVYPYNPTIGFIGDSVTVGFGGPNVGAEDHVVQQFITQMGGAPYKALNK